MYRSYPIAGATLLVSIFSSTTYAEPPHHGGLPPGLQKKLERGERLPPGWSGRAAVYSYGYDESSYGRDGYVESYSDQYEPERLDTQADAFRVFARFVSRTIDGRYLQRHPPLESLPDQ